MNGYPRIRSPFVTTQTPDPARTRKVLWLANLSAIMFIAGLILFLPDLVSISPIPSVQTPVLVLAVLSVPVAFLAARLTGAGNPRVYVETTLKQDPALAQKAVSRFALAGTLAELPAMFGLVYAIIGGNSFYALVFAAAALLASIALRPE